MLPIWVLWVMAKHFVAFDEVLQTMKETGREMQDKYKETSRGGLAVSTVEC